MNTNFTPMTDEQREAAKQSRLDAQEYARLNLKITYMDEPYWREIAREVGCRLPHWWLPGTNTKYLRRICKKLDIELKMFIDSTGFANIKDFCLANRKYTALALSGLLLEWYKDNEVTKCLV